MEKSQIRLSASAERIGRAIRSVVRLANQRSAEALKQRDALTDALGNIRPDGDGYIILIECDNAHALGEGLARLLRTLGVSVYSESEPSANGTYIALEDTRPHYEAVLPMIDASTCHLDFGVDDRLLDEWARNGYRAASLPRTLKHTYGWVLYTSGDSNSQEEELTAMREAGCSDGLVGALRYAHRAGAYILNFDQDCVNQLFGVPIYSGEASLPVADEGYARNVPTPSPT